MNLGFLVTSALLFSANLLSADGGKPTLSPTQKPNTKSPVTNRPTSTYPTVVPSKIPTAGPSKTPTAEPSKDPTDSPSLVPSIASTNAETNAPTPGCGSRRLDEIITIDEIQKKPLAEIEELKEHVHRLLGAITTKPTARPTVRPTTNSPSKSPTESPSDPCARRNLSEEKLSFKDFKGMLTDKENQKIFSTEELVAVSEMLSQARSKVLSVDANTAIGSEKATGIINNKNTDSVDGKYDWKVQNNWGGNLTGWMGYVTKPHEEEKNEKKVMLRGL